MRFGLGLPVAVAAAGFFSASLLAQEPPSPPAPAPKGLAGVGLTKAQVDKAVDRATQYLVSELARRLKRMDKPAKKPHQLQDDELLILLALSHTDAFKKEPELGRRALTALYATDLGKTYDSAVTILALEHLGGPLHKELVVEATKALVTASSRGPGQGWRYGRDVDAPARTVPSAVPDAEDPAIEITGGSPIFPPSLGKVEGEGAFKEEGDGSCTQFALLGLHSAAKIGVEPPTAVWDKGVDYFTKAQREDGGWAYRPKGGKGSYGSMTCAGIAGLAIAYSHRGALAPAEDEHIRRGLAWLAANWTLETNPGPKEEEHYHYYYLYGVERVGVLLGTELLGGHEWYPEGARYLLAQQAPNGSWTSPHRGATIRDTSYAVLFLTRATTPLYGPSGGQGTLATALVAPPAPKTGLLFVLDASDSMNEKVGGKRKWEIVRDAAKRLVARLPEGALVGLRVYGHNPPNPKKVDESETQLLLPVRKLDRELFDRTVDAIVPKGRTPIAMSFDRCVGDLAAGPPCRVLLLSDGAETGGGDPVSSAKRLAASEKCLGIDCLAFDCAKDQKARDQMMEVARAGRGRYVEAEDPEVIAEFGAAPDTIDWVLLDATGTERAKGKSGERKEFPEGRYKVRVVIGGVTHERGLWINGGKETTARFHLDGKGRP